MLPTRRRNMAESLVTQHYLDQVSATYDTVKVDLVLCKVNFILLCFYAMIDPNWRVFG